MRLIPGALAGLVATLVLSAIMMAKSMMGLMPELDVITMLAGMMGAGLAMGWIAHFMIGIGYGVVLSIVENAFELSLTLKGMLLGALGWLVMMVAVMPMAGAGLFGLELGMPVPVMTLVLHLIFGAVLGFTYDRIR